MALINSKRFLSVTLTLLGLLGLWQLICWIFTIPSYILPVPTEIIGRMVTDIELLLRHSFVTLGEVMLGFIMAVAIGIPLAIIIVYSRYFSESFFPIIVGIHCVPMVSLAPLLIIWFGFGLLTKVLIAFLISFFPIVINTVVGLQSMDKEMLYLAKSLRANKVQTFLYFRLPKALSSIFGGLKVGITLAVVGAVVAEFVASEKGLGYLQLMANSQLDVTMEFAVIFMLGIIGIGLFQFVALLEKWCMPWYQANRKDV